MTDLFANEEIDLPKLLLDDGQARCEFCEGEYSVQLEVRCAVCERPLCPLCATRARSSFHCPECRPTTKVAPPPLERG